MKNEKRLIDADALLDKIRNSTASEATKVTAFVFADIAPTVDAVEVDTVAEMLAYVHGDECACNFGCHDEWLSMVCDYAETECPHPTEPNGCWKQFVKHWGERKDNERKAD